jgi:hypothetical protein
LREVYHGIRHLRDHCRPDHRRHHFERPTTEELTMHESTAKADGAAIATWVAYFLSHLTETNQLLQFFCLVLGLISGIYALLYHILRWRRLKKEHERRT